MGIISSFYLKSAVVSCWNKITLQKAWSFIVETLFNGLSFTKIRHKHFVLSLFCIHGLDYILIKGKLSTEAEDVLVLFVVYGFAAVTVCKMMVHFFILYKVKKWKLERIHRN